MTALDLTGRVALVTGGARDSAKGWRTRSLPPVPG